VTGSILLRCAAAALFALAIASCPALAQKEKEKDKGVPNALQGFSQNRDQPVKIDAATLEVRDKDKVATFSGDVKVVQGDTTLRCRSLQVYYDQENNPNNLKTAQPGPQGQQQIRKLEAKGGVVVTQKDQTATGELATFEMRTNTVTLTGNVLVTQGQNVLRGERLVVDLTSGVSRVEAGKPGQGGRVQGLFLPGGSGGDSKPAIPGSSSTPPKPRPSQSHPTGIY
jgi:lipopolysaccharide export system protein LptA